MRSVALITDDDLHASLQCMTSIGSPHCISASVQTEGSGSSGVSPHPQPHAGAAAAHQPMGEG